MEEKGRKKERAGMGRGGKVTDRQAVFVQEYLVDLNATQAAIRAKYSVKTAYRIGAQLLQKTSVAEAIQKAMREREKRTQITQDKVLEELARLGFANMGDYMKSTSDGDPIVDFSQLTRDQMAALQEVTVDDYIDGRGEDARAVKKVRFKLADKRAALVDIGRHLGMFIERHAVSTSNAEVQVYRMPDNGRD